MADTTRFGISMSQDLLDKFDRMIQKKGYTNRSEALRDLVRNALIEDMWEKDTGTLAGTITIIYDHNSHGITDTLTHMQHHFHHLIISTVHVHFDEKNCLEVLIVKGMAQEIKKLHEKLSSLKGVKHSRLSVTGII
ncbi:nickel-responsive transcriptional regulator NikR [Thermosediminibacter litoriperuensis]|uniref:Putative nickel-responsive regulator n=1 Tax=Thermosediminibacter litoriperuensis TaxID=291989 RepID=A0A5S5AZ30_9FIRM|nr:nickel-responsive transcriptional regulator NikR [Thermosediminibacter litoriperuensis]TYP58535.1 CopG family nickel-responsive transcriptional regulator [Thermosediminibacter litoriperuensis]